MNKVRREVRSSTLYMHVALNESIQYRVQGAGCRVHPSAGQQFTLFYNGLALLCSSGDLQVWEPLEEVSSRETQKDVSFD